MIGGKPRGLAPNAILLYPALTLGVFFVVPFGTMLAMSFFRKSDQLYEPAFELTNYAQFLTVFFGLIARIAPLWWEPHRDRLRLMAGPPGAQILEMPPLGPAAAAFLTLVLASVSFDGLHDTFRWLAFIGVNPLEFPGRSAVTLQNTLGLIAAWGVARLVREIVPDFVTLFRAQDIVAVFAGTVIMALVASFVPVRRINSIDPAIVFRA